MKGRLSEGRGVAYVGVVLGIAISIAGNVANAYVDTVSPPRGVVISSVIWPLILFLTLEIMLAARWPAGWYFQVVRWGVLGVVGAVAAVVSYQHLSGLLHHWGESEFAWRFGPLAVDGLLVMASTSLVLTRLRASATPEPASAPAPVPVDVPAAAPVPARQSVSDGLPVPVPVVVPAVAATEAPARARQTVRVPATATDRPLSGGAQLVLEALPGTVTDLARRTDLKRSTVDYVLKKSLEALVRVDGDKVWHRAEATM